MKLIENWRDALKMRTVQWGLALAMVPSLLFELALALGEVLPSLPVVVLEYLPANVRTALAVAGVVSVVLRLVAQVKLQQPPKKED